MAYDEGEHSCGSGENSGARDRVSSSRMSRLLRVIGMTGVGGILLWRLRSFLRIFLGSNDRVLGFRDWIICISASIAWYSYDCIPQASNVIPPLFCG